MDNDRKILNQYIAQYIVNNPDTFAGYMEEDKIGYYILNTTQLHEKDEELPNKLFHANPVNLLLYLLDSNAFFHWNIRPKYESVGNNLNASIHRFPEPLDPKILGRSGNDIRVNIGIDESGNPVFCYDKPLELDEKTRDQLKSFRSREGFKNILDHVPLKETGIGAETLVSKLFPKISNDDDEQED